MSAPRGFTLRFDGSGEGASLYLGLDGVSISTPMGFKTLQFDGSGGGSSLCLDFGFDGDTRDEEPAPPVVEATTPPLQPQRDTSQLLGTLEHPYQIQVVNIGMDLRRVTDCISIAKLSNGCEHVMRFVLITECGKASACDVVTRVDLSWVKGVICTVQECTQPFTASVDDPRTHVEAKVEFSARLTPGCEHDDETTMYRRSIMVPFSFDTPSYEKLDFAYFRASPIPVIPVGGVPGRSRGLCGDPKLRALPRKLEKGPDRCVPISINGKH
jgi:hypothetical protein